LFSGIAFSHRDDAAGFATGRPNNQDHSFVEEANGEEAFLAIIRPVVGQGELRALEQLHRVGEIQTALIERFSAFLLVELDVHVGSAPPT